MIMRKYLLLFTILVFSSLFAQHEKCGMEAHMQEMMKDPEKVAEAMRVQQEVAAAMKDQRTRREPTVFQNFHIFLS